MVLVLPTFFHVALLATAAALYADKRRWQHLCHFGNGTMARTDLSRIQFAGAWVGRDS